MQRFGKSILFIYRPYTQKRLWFPGRIRRAVWYNDATQITVPVPGAGDNTVISDLVWPLQSAGCVFAVIASTTLCLSNALQIIVGRSS